MGHIDPGQTAEPDDVVTKIFNDSSIHGVIDHEMTFVSKSGKLSVANAQSFSNSYSVFTVIDQPVEKSVHASGSINPPQL